jgi:hypothetical protein
MLVDRLGLTHSSSALLIDPNCNSHNRGIDR